MQDHLDSNHWEATARFVEGIKFLRAFEKDRDWDQLDNAARNFLEATEIDPDYKAARFYLGVSNELIGRHEEASLQFEQLSDKSDQPDLELLYNLGLAYFHQYHLDAYKTAIMHLNRVVALSRSAPSVDCSEPRRSSIRLLAQATLAQVYSHLSALRDESPEDARKHFKEALEIASQSLGELEAGRDRLDKALLIDIEWGLHNAKGHAYLYAGRRESRLEYFEESISEFKLALELDQKNYRVLSNLGSAHLFLAKLVGLSESQDHLTSAEHLFEEVLKLKPNYDFAYARLAQIALLRNDCKEAKKFLDLAKENPSEMTSEYLERVYQEIEEAEDAESD